MVDGKAGATFFLRQLRVTWRDYHVLPHCCQPSPLKRSICRVKWDTLSQFDGEDQNDWIILKKAFLQI